MADGAPAPTRSLEARYYTDPAIYAAEMRNFFTRTWAFAGHVSQVDEPGAYFAFEVAGQNLFCVRGRDGALRTFYNVCQHRAHELVKGAGVARVIVCPYHAWTYELSGGLRAGPNIAAVPGFDKAEICLTEVRTEIFCGFIFVNLDDDAKPMDEWYPGVRDALADYVPNIERLAPLEWIEVPERCNWKVSVENYSECYHCALNHPTFATGVVKPETYDIQPQEGYVLRHVTECQGVEAMTYPVDLSVRHASDYSSWFLWPGVSFQVYPGNILNLYVWRATGPETCTVWRGWFTEGGEENEVIRRLAAQDLETTVKEDIALVESVQRGMNSRGYRPGPLVLDPVCGVNSEHSIERLQQWMREAAGKGSEAQA